MREVREHIRHRSGAPDARAGARLIGRLIEDVVTESRRRIFTAAPTSSDEVRAAGTGIAGFSAMMASTTAPSKSSCGRTCTATARHRRHDPCRGGGARSLARFFVQPHYMPEEWAQGSRAPMRRRARAALPISSPNDDGFRVERARAVIPESLT